ncbi:MAG: non-ribosomal peptide synthetase, partial [Roseomonas sp.]|nr:non-ribosomal peptide synthetase [Roseomonas sp.]
PFAPGQRIYRSKDQGYWRDDGQLVFAGRNDAQMKVRGHRIEAAEVEAAMLAAIPTARQVAVVAQGSGAEAILVGWIGTDQPPDADATHEALRAMLPEWMVPSRLACLPSLPLTPSGKIDRRALTARPVEANTPATAMPEGALEAQVAAIWEEVLDRTGIGRRQNFFALGGHSLAVLRVLARVERQLGAEVPVAAFYGAPTVADLARAIATAAPARAGLTAAPGVDGAMPLSPAQLRLWLIAELLPEATGYAMPAAFVLEGPLDTHALCSAIDALQTRHEALRTVFIEQDGEPRQSILPASPIALIAEPVGGIAEATCLAAEDIARPFDLAAAPPVRWRLLRTEAASHVLLFNMHHIVGDGTSLAIMATELGHLYDAFAAGMPDPLPPLTLRYRDAIAAIGHRRDNGTEAEAWWRAQFAAPPPVLSLAPDAPRTGSPAGPGALCPVGVPAGLATALRDFAATHDATPFAVTLALVARLLHEECGDRDIVIGIPVAGRFHADLQDQVGLYAETCPIRVSVYPGEPFPVLLARVTATLGAALAHDAFGFDMLMEAVDPVTPPGRSPFFDVMLSWQVAATVPLGLSGLGVRALPLPVPGAQFDLCFNVLDTEAGLDLSILHRADLYGGNRIEALGARLVALAHRVLGPEASPPDLTPEVLRLWQEVLGRADIGIDTPFVEAGGHSLKAARLVSRMHAAFGRTLRLREIFAHPTIRAQAALLAAAPEAKPAPTPTVSIPEPLPLASAGQRRIWTLAQLAGDPAVYAIASVLHLDGMLDIPALQAALGSLVARHEALRTVFEPGPDGLRQRILAADAAGFRLPLLQPEEAAALPLAFDLARGPLFQARLIRDAPASHRLEIVIHHAIGDGWSVGVLARDLGALYAAAHYGRPAPMPALPFQYRDAMRRQDAWRASTAGTAARLYWREALAGDLPMLDLPTDRPRPALQTFRGALHEARLGTTALAPLRHLAALRGTSLFAVLLAAVHVVLHRYSGQDDIVIGTPVAGRIDADLEDQVGLYANTLALRTRCLTEAPFTALLAQMHETISGALEHQLYPFDALVEDLAAPRDPSRSPVFDVMVAMQDEAAAAPILDGLAVRLGGEAGGIAKFDLSIHLRAAEDGLNIWLEYNTDLFDAARMARMAEHLATVLRAIPDAADRAIGRLPLLTLAEATQALRWTAPVPQPDAPATLIEAFAGQVARVPERPAVRDREGALTYAALDAHANGIAAALLNLGLSRGDPVAVAMRRGTALPTAILGIWKAGLVYVPLDLAQPAARRALLMADAGCRALIGTSGDDSIPVLDAATVPPQPNPPAVPAVTAGDTAYILYTSGSTGAPKGVRIAHRNLAAFAPVLRETFALDESDTVVALTTISFDISLLELVCPLAHGMAVTIAGDEDCADPVATLDWLRDSGATVLQATPSRLALLLRDGGRLGALRHILVGGERLPPGLAASLRALRHADGTPLAVTNVYGPTETTIWSTAEPIGDTPPGIGWALPGEAVLILSPLGEEQPVGIPGEIAITGTGVGQGYLAQPALTTERFAARADGTPCYRTGDRGMRRGDGGIDYLGRIDDQVKLHGFRIEPGEIEAALRAHPALRAAAVAVRTLRGQPELVGYVVAPGLPVPGAGEAALRAHLLARLPRHMVPAYFMALPELPLLPSGKLDRKALPVPAEAPAPAGVPAWVAGPGDAVLSVVLRHWGRVLLNPAATPDDEFFESGGHSLRAAELAGLLQAELGVPVGLRDLFLSTSPRTLAAALSQRRPIGTPGLVASVEAADYPLSRAQRRLFVLDRLQPGSCASLIAGAFRLEGPLDVTALGLALDATIARHEALRTAFRMIGDEPRQIVMPAAPGALRFQDLGETDPEARAEAICAEDARTPFDLAEAPLLRARLLRLGADRHVLAFAVHHIVADGVSLGLLLDDLEHAYLAACDGTVPLLPPAPFQYRDHVTQEAAMAGTPRWRASGEWWRQHLAGELPVLDLPTARPRPARQGGRGGQAAFSIDAPTFARLDAMARGQGATAFMVLLAAGAALFHRLTGATDMVLGSVSGTRAAPELAGVVGCFVNPLPLRLAVPAQAGFAALLRQTRDVVLQALDHADYPFDALVHDLHAGGDPSRSPLFDIGFSWNALPHMARQDFAGCALVAVPTPAAAAKYDLLFIAAPGEGGIQGVVEYAAELFDAAAVEAMLRRLEAILAQVSADPDLAIDLLTLHDGPAGIPAAQILSPSIELQF